MKRPQKIKINHNSEFELDLAPLLAVMVKLVPVLLISSAFVQLMVIEAELPQFVNEAIQKQGKDPRAIKLSIEVHSQQGFRIYITENGIKSSLEVPLKKGVLDLEGLRKKMVGLKKQHPEIFKVELNPDAQIPYGDIVKIMDELRQTRESGLTFPVFDSKNGKTIESQFMFPEVVFANVMEGPQT